jgi:hypothetical protein
MLPCCMISSHSSRSPLPDLDALRSHAVSPRGSYSRLLSQPSAWCPSPLFCLVSSPFALNSFRIRTSEKWPSKPFRIRTSKTKDLKPFRMNTYKKMGGGVPIGQNKARLAVRETRLPYPVVSLLPPHFFTSPLAWNKSPSPTSSQEREV